MEDTLGDVIKAYEAESTFYHDPMKPIYIRLDGRSFSKVTRKLAKPFSSLFIEMMKDTTKSLIEEFNCDLGFCQSDEISLTILPRPDSKGFEFPFKGKQAKLQSLMASHATWKFNKLIEANKGYLNIDLDAPVCFDARSMSMSYEDTALAFLWRHKDATRNGILQFAHNSGHLTKKSLHKKKTFEILEMLAAEGVDWSIIDPSFRYGTFIKAEMETIENDEGTRYDRRYLNEHCVDRSYHFVYDFIVTKYLLPGELENVG